jgi:pyruvate,orthophosphate dikinase
LEGSGEALVNFVLNRETSVGVELERRLASGLSDVLAAAKSHPVTIKLISSALSNFLPSLETLAGEIAALKVAKELEKDFNRGEELERKEQLFKIAQQVRESNPLLGIRGVRLSSVVPEMFSIQIRSILDGARAARRRGASPDIRILLPAVSDAREVSNLDAAFRDVLLGSEETAELGVLIECPRTCLTAGPIAQTANVLCIDTDALHESTFGYCQEDGERVFLSKYIDLGILEEVPYATIDQEGVGQLMKICVEEAKAEKPDISVTVCGVNCYDQKSVDFCYSLGVESVTCRPAMVPVARLCAAQAILASKA